MKFLDKHYLLQFLRYLDKKVLRLEDSSSHIRKTLVILEVLCIFIPQLQPQTP